MITIWCANGVASVYRIDHPSGIGCRWLKNARPRLGHIVSTSSCCRCCVMTLATQHDDISPPKRARLESSLSHDAAWAIFRSKIGYRPKVSIRNLKRKTPMIQWEPRYCFLSSPFDYLSFFLNIAYLLLANIPPSCSSSPSNSRRIIINKRDYKNRWTPVMIDSCSRWTYTMIIYRNIQMQMRCSGSGSNRNIT